jgi:hypothetical protein
MDTQEQRMWMAQWRAAAEALAQVRREELAAMTAADAAAAACAVMEFPHDAPILAHQSEDAATSGLVTQQAIFAKAGRP